MTLTLGKAPDGIEKLSVMKGRRLNIPFGHTEYCFFEWINWSQEEQALILGELEKYQIISQSRLPWLKRAYGDDTQGYTELLVKFMRCPKKRPSDPNLEEAFIFRHHMTKKLSLGWLDAIKMGRFCEELWRKRESSKSASQIVSSQGTTQLRVTETLQNPIPKVNPPTE